MGKLFNSFKNAKWWIVTFAIWTLIGIFIFAFPPLREHVRLYFEWLFFLQGIIFLPSLLVIIVIELPFAFLDLGLNVSPEWLSWTLLVLFSLIIGAIEGYIVFLIVQSIKKLIQNKKAKMVTRRKNE